MTEPNSSQQWQMVKQEAEVTNGGLGGSDGMLGKKFLVGKVCSPGTDHQRGCGNLHPWRGFNYLLDKAIADLI